MSADLQEFNDIIESLKAEINQPDFDQLFKQATQDVPKAKQFLIKMELKRLAQPCNRVIDLRGSVDGDPQAYEYKGQIHYLDNIAIDIFEQQIAKFGRYTIGTFEAVTKAENNFRVMHKKEQEQRLAEREILQQSNAKPQTEPVDNDIEVLSEHPADMVQFCSYGIRNEERMNFSINVELQFGIGNVLKATTSDLSVSGAKVKIPAAKEVAKRQKVAMYLTGLEQEFQLGLKDGIQYEIVGIDPAGDEFNYIRLKRTFSEDVTSFDDFLERFINGNKRRYKVNLENTLEAIQVKAFEQYYLPRVNWLPIYLRKINQRLVPTMVLATENNRESLGYFSDENKNLVLQQIVNEKRINDIVGQKSKVKETILYSFTHAKAGKLYFYSATSLELADNHDLRNLFLGFGSKKASWRVFKLQVVNADENDGYIPLSVPDNADEAVKKANQPPTPKVAAMLKNVRHIAVLTPLEHQQHAHLYQQHYQFASNQLNLLKTFGHPKLKRYISIAVETIDYVNLRSEERYLYKTAVTIPATEDELMPLAGSTRDFSSHGLQVVLDNPCEFKKGDVIELDLPDLQKVTKKFKLANLSYEVMAVSKSKTIMNLRTYDNKAANPAIAFFKKLITQNINKLTPAKMESRYPGLSACLRNLIARQAPNLSMYLSKESTKLAVRTMAHSYAENALYKLLRLFKPTSADIGLYPLLRDGALSTQFAGQIQKMNRTDKPKYLEVYVKYLPDQLTEETAFISYYQDQMTTDSRLTDFIESCDQDKAFFAYRIALSRTGRPDMDFVSKELNYVSHYAQHRAKELEEKLWSTVGVADIIDVSEEVMLRLGLPKTHLVHQQQVKAKLLKL